MTTESVYASESGHWYTQSGVPCYELPNASKPGEMRPTTLRDAKKLKLVPSVSGILGVMAKHGLDKWKQEQVAKAALAAPIGMSENVDEYVQYVLNKASESMGQARDLGTQIHGEIERYLLEYEKYGEDAIPSGHYEHVNAAVDALKEMGVWGQRFGVEKSFASPLGYGGKIDLRGGDWIVDFKCVDRLDKRLAYPDRAAQLTAYSKGVFGGWDHIQMRLVNCFISTSEPGKYLLHEWSEEDKIQGWRLFCACLELWKVMNKYDPSLSI